MRHSRKLQKNTKTLYFGGLRSFKVIAGTNRLLVPPVGLSTVGNRAFTVAGPRVWNTLPEDVTTSQSLTMFCRHLKTWLFRKSYPDIIV